MSSKAVGMPRRLYRPDRLNALRKVATVESTGSSTCIEGAKLTDAQVGTLLSNIRMQLQPAC